MRAWMLRTGVIVLGGLLLWALFGTLLGHNPNHDIDREQAQEAADRVHAPPPPGLKMERGHGG